MITNTQVRKSSVALEADKIDRERKRAESQVALFFAVLIGLFAALGIFLAANSEKNSDPKVLGDCEYVQPSDARLACFDKLSQVASTPFKGAAPKLSDGE